MHSRKPPRAGRPAFDEITESDEIPDPKRAPTHAEIIAEDEAFFVVKKPAGMFIEGGLFDDPSVCEQLASTHGLDPAELHPVFPPDIDISGILLLARSRDAAINLSAQLADHRLCLTYHAVVRGMMIGDHGQIDLPVTSPKGGRVKAGPQGGEPALTEWRVLDTYIGFALLECIPRTALAQQVRAHLHAAGFPLAVDSLHGGSERLMLSSFKAGYHPSKRHPERPLIARPSLHAQSLTFEHPGDGRRVRFEAAMPKDFRATVNQLGRFGRIAK